MFGARFVGLPQGTTGGPDTDSRLGRGPPVPESRVPSVSFPTEVGLNLVLPVPEGPTPSLVLVPEEESSTGDGRRGPRRSDVPGPGSTPRTVGGRALSESGGRKGWGVWWWDVGWGLTHWGVVRGSLCLSSWTPY